ncbi:uncharacterized protein LOC142166864 [Nicotiana tabacum]|uniref:Uncharacterized protein LOC142166864 n=1 Tax=Nicotiana tabacum TaxID=4097 RepID=A0AC58SC43_TOBAC
MQSKQKSYVDKKVRDVAFIEGEMLFLEFHVMKGVMRFWKEGKLSPRYIYPFEMLESVGEKYYEDKSHVLNFNSVQLDENPAYEEGSVVISDRMVQKLRSKDNASAKVQ